MATVIAEFVEQSIFRIEKNTPKILKCLDHLSEEQVWMRPNEASNSIGNILLHLCGNIRQYAIAALGNQDDVRERDLEFSTRSGYTKHSLVMKLQDTLQEAIAIMRNIDELRLLKLYAVQGFTQSGIGIIVHVTEHYSYHTGQIIFWTKQLTGTDLGFYSTADLNKRNQR